MRNLLRLQKWWHIQAQHCRRGRVCEDDSTNVPFFENTWGCAWLSGLSNASCPDCAAVGKAKTQSSKVLTWESSSSNPCNTGFRAVLQWPWVKLSPAKPPGICGSKGTRILGMQKDKHQQVRARTGKIHVHLFFRFNFQWFTSLCFFPNSSNTGSAQINSRAEFSPCVIHFIFFLLFFWSGFTATFILWATAVWTCINVLLSSHTQKSNELVTLAFHCLLHPVF